MRNPVVLATDGSEIAGYATQEACRLARALDVPLHAVNVANTDEYEGRFARLGRDVEIEPRKLLELGENVVAEAATRAEKFDVPVETHVLEGPPAPALTDHASNVDAWGLVLGSHHQGDLEHAVLGSVADRVVRMADVPVMTIRGSPRARPTDPYERLLVPTDGSHETKWAANRAFNLARTTGAILEFVHVIPPEIEEGPYWREDGEMDEVIEELEREALDPLVQSAEDDDIQYETTTARGNIHEAILDQADASDPDAIVIATHGWGGADRFWLGSVADKILRESSYPVITVGGDSGG